jgi:hypothetical protein
MTINSTRRQGESRHRPSVERDAPSDTQPLDVRRLTRIWHQLPESDRLPFLLALDEKIGDQLLEATMPKVLDSPPDPWKSDSKDMNDWVARQYARIAAEADKRPPTINLNKLDSEQLRRVMACTSPEQFAALATEFAATQPDKTTQRS